jgi:hypothetical protein
MTSAVATVEEYLASLPADRQSALRTLRDAILEALDPGFAEGMQYGMIGYFVPHARYPAGYHCDPKQPLPFAALASQKNYMSVYLFGLYPGTPNRAWFEAEFAKRGKKLDMGAGCVRFKKLDDLPLDVIQEAVRKWTVDSAIARYEATIPPTKRKTKA